MIIFLLGCGRYETELNLRSVVEADSARLRGILGEMKLSIGDLENQLSGLKEELLYMKKSHEEVTLPFHCNHLVLNYFTKRLKCDFWKTNCSFPPLLSPQDLHLLRERQSGSVNVEMDCAAQSDLDKELQEMRAQYEMLIEKNRREAERWFQSKVSQ